MSEEHEMEELQEAAEHGREQSSLAPVSFTMAILAGLVAVAALLSHRAHTEEVLLQDKATDTVGLLSGEEHSPQYDVTGGRDSEGSSAEGRGGRRGPAQEERSGNREVTTPTRKRFRKEAKATEGEVDSLHASRQSLRPGRDSLGSGTGHLLDHAAYQATSLLARGNCRLEWREWY